MCVVILCVFAVLCVYCCFTLDVGLLARSQYPEGPANGHFDTGFSWFPCAEKQMLRWFSAGIYHVGRSSASGQEVDALSSRAP